MRIINPNDEAAPFYAGKCKNNEAPKHVLSDVAEKKKVKLDGKVATMINSPKTAEYIYVKQGENWLYIKDKTVFAQDELKTTKVTRASRKEDEPAEPITPNA